jgi:Lipocalin-like domain
MKKLFPLTSLTLFMILATSLSGRQDRAATGGARDQFIGAWHLAWLEEPDTNGKVQRADCTGLLVNSPDGHMSVQVMYRNPQSGSDAAPVQYAQGGYEASFGTYEINEQAHSFSYHVEGALVRTLIGTDLKRVYELHGNQLIVKSPDPSEHWRVAWQRY